MSAPRLITLLVAVAGAFCGCCFHKDLTNSATIQANVTFGQRLHATEQLELVKDTHTRILFLAKRGYPPISRDKPVGVVEAGTELRVNRVVRITELVAILVFLPEYYSWNCTLAKIEGGPYAGKEVAVDGKGLHFKDAATVGSGMLGSSEAKDNHALQPTATDPSVSTNQ